MACKIPVPGALAFLKHSSFLHFPLGAGSAYIRGFDGVFFFFVSVALHYPSLKEAGPGNGELSNHTSILLIRSWAVCLLPPKPGLQTHLAWSECTSIHYLCAMQLCYSITTGYFCEILEQVWKMISHSLELQRYSTLSLHTVLFKTSLYLYWAQGREPTFCSWCMNKHFPALFARTTSFRRGDGGSFFPPALIHHCESQSSHNYLMPFTTEQVCCCSYTGWN